MGRGSVPEAGSSRSLDRAESTSARASVKDNLFVISKYQHFFRWGRSNLHTIDQVEQELGNVDASQRREDAPAPDPRVDLEELQPPLGVAPQLHAGRPLEPHVSGPLEAEPFHLRIAHHPPFSGAALRRL